MIAAHHDLQFKVPEEAFGEFIDQAEPRQIPLRLRELLLQRADPAQVAVVEPNYIDIDFSASHYNQRGRSFTPSERSTTRVHFFSSGEVSEIHFRLPTAPKRKLLEKSYLGFIVIRPGSEPTVGRTIIKPPQHVNGTQAYFPTKGSFDAHIQGLELGIEASPFLSQDSIALACATAGIWMSATPLAAKIQLSQFTTTEITSMALSLTRPYGPSLGMRGLTIDEMGRAFLRMGHDPMLWEYPTAEQLMEVCHLYAESGIPTILGVQFPRGLHALTVIGHTFDLDSRRGRPLRPGIFASTEFVPGLVVHDDQGGPYLPLELGEVKNSQSFRTKVKLSLPGGELIGHCKFAIAPIPPRAALPGTKALRLAAFWRYLQKVCKQSGGVPSL